MITAQMDLFWQQRGMTNDLYTLSPPYTLLNCRV